MSDDWQYTEEHVSPNDPIFHGLRWKAERDRLAEALAELYAAGLALVPCLPPINAQLSIRWDEAMGAADALLAKDTSA